MTELSGDVHNQEVPKQAPGSIVPTASNWKALACVGLVAGLVLAGGALFVLKRPLSPESKPHVEAMCYVLQTSGKWYRQDNHQELKPGQELFAGEVLQPERADRDHELTVYLFGKGAQQINGGTGPYVVPSSTTNNPDSIDRLVALLPSVNRMFPEATIARGDSDQSAGSPLLLNERGLDVSPLLRGEPKGNGKRRVRLRFNPLSLAALGTNETTQKDARTDVNHSAARESSAPVEETAALRPPSTRLEFPYIWNPRRPQLLSPVPGLQPGLYRLELWSGPGSKSPAPVDDAEAFPDREYLVIVLTRSGDYDKARTEYDSFQKGAKTNWNRNLPPEMTPAFHKAFLSSLAERYLPLQEPARQPDVP
jgi:hypothetical protein